MTRRTILSVVAGAIAALLVLAPTAGVFAVGTAIPLEKKVAAGTTTVEYAGQRIRFTTPVALIARFESVSATQFKLDVWAYGAHVAGPSGVSGPDLTIFWEDFNSQVYAGPPPPDSAPFSGIFNTEGGFTDR